MAKKPSRKPKPNTKTSAHKKGEEAGTALNLNQRAFLAAYAVMGNITQAAAVAKVHPDTPRVNWKGQKTYDEAFAQAQETAADGLEQEARRRATEGVRRLKFHEGQAIMFPCNEGDPGAIKVGKDWMRLYEEHEYSDTLLIFLLKAARPKKFRESIKHDHSGEIGVKMYGQEAPLARV